MAYPLSSTSLPAARIAERRTRHPAAFRCLLLLALFSGPAAAVDQPDAELAGDVLQLALPATGWWITRDDPSGRRQWWRTMGGALGTTWVLKAALDRERPNGGSWSYPSGHTTAAFAGAGFIARRYGPSGGIPALLLAGFTGWSRVVSNNHDWVDVVAGAAIGSVAAHLFTKPRDTELAVWRQDRALGLSLRMRL